ncbi:MAG TPA: sucrase ferredoxin [Acidimicrobiales bacterium]|nr:sucrase ferredoxin [Acidimicrobiales bacterium]
MAKVEQGDASKGVLTCSDWARSQQLSPIGTAGFYSGFLLVETPMPWPADIAEIPELKDVALVAAAANLRLQAVSRVGSDGGPGAATAATAALDERHLVLYQRRWQPSGQASVAQDKPQWADKLERSETVAPASALASAATALIEAVAAPTAAPGLAVPPRATAEPTRVVDLLICTHGRRDVCCGSKGTGLASSIAVEPVAHPDAEVRTWRTSHTGGHRFAPTAIFLPDATLWAFAERPLLQQVVAHSGDIGAALPFLRGSACLGPPAQQALEKAVLSEVGWELLAVRRQGSDLGDGRAQLYTDRFGTWVATVREARRVPQPDCRTDPANATKFGPEWVVEDLQHRDDGADDR